jgi:hypothetical protein
MRQLLKAHDLAIYHHQLTFEKKQKEYYRMSRVAPLKDRSRLIMLVDRIEEQIENLRLTRNIIAADIADAGKDYELWRDEMETNQIDLYQAMPDVVPSAASAVFSASSSRLDTAS